VAILARLDGAVWLVVALPYGAGVRLQEALDLRVKDIDFERHQITVRQGKGRTDRVTMLPSAITERLRAHLSAVGHQHTTDLAHGLGRAPLPDALDRKYPNAGSQWAWQFVFPAGRICRDARWARRAGFILHESAVQRAVADAVRKARIPKKASCHTSGIRLRRICSRTGMTSGPFRNCLGMPR